MFPQTEEIRAGRGRGSGWRLRRRYSDAPKRALNPLEVAVPMCRARRADPLKPCEWGSALEAFCEGFRRVQAAHGKEAASWTVSPNLTNEELAFSSSLARHSLGLVAGPPRPAPLLSPAWEAPEESDVVIAFGPATTAADSPLWQRLCCNRHQPRLIALAEGAAMELPGECARYSPQPGSTLTLLYGLANIIIAGGWADHTFIEKRTTGCMDYAALVAQYTTDRVSAETGLAAECVWELAEAIGTGARVSFCGRPETSAQAESALRNLALLTGQWGRPGTGVCMELEPANALGAHLFGQAGSLAPCEAAADAGRLKALWVMASDAGTAPEEAVRWDALAQRLDLLVVQGGRPEGLARHADLFLPTAGWRAKEGTRLDPSGRLRLLKPGPHLPGAVMTDFHLFKLVAQYWGCGAFFSRWSSPEAAFQILKGNTRGSAHDFSGVPDYAAIDAYRPAVASAPEATRLPFVFD